MRGNKIIVWSIHLLGSNQLQHSWFRLPLIIIGIIVCKSTMQSDEMRYVNTCDSAPSLSRLVMDISSDADVFVGGLAFASRTSRNLCICDSVCVFVADRRGKAPARQRCTAITHPIMTPVRHGIRHQLCLRLLAGGGRRGRGLVGMRKRRPNMGLTSPAGPAGEWKAITKGPIPQLITVCYLPELTSKKNWNYREGKGGFAKPEGEQVFQSFQNNRVACFLHAVTFILPLIELNIWQRGYLYLDTLIV